MKRDAVSQVLQDPVAHTTSFFLIVVLPRNHEIRNLKPDIGFVLEPPKGIENGIEMGESQLVVKALREAFEIDIGGVDVTIDIASRLGRDVACGHHHAFKSVFARAPRDIDHELTPDDRIVVGKGNAWNLVPQSQRNHLFGTCADASRGVKLCLANAPVLAKTTP